MLENIEAKKQLKIIFMGTPDFSVPVLEGLIEAYPIRAIIAQPDRLVGRDKKLAHPPTKEVGIKHTILVIQPEKIEEAVDEILGLEPDLIITCAYGQKLPDILLNAPKYGCINVHASLLPKLRGGAPIHRAIMQGYTKTGITIMQMNDKMDGGDIISQRELEIFDNDTATSLYDRLTILARDLLLETLPSIIDKTAPRIKQNEEEATYAFTIKRADEHLRFNRTRREVYNHVRGLNSWPGAYCIFENKILKVWECRTTQNTFSDKFDGQITAIYEDGFGVKVSNGEVVITVVQPEGRKKMSALDFINGIPNKEIITSKVLM